MSKLKLTIDQLKNYLGAGLKMEIMDYKSDYVNLQYDRMIGVHQWDSLGKFWSVLTVGGSKPEVSRVKPICYRLSDLDKEIEVNGERFVPLNRLVNDDPEKDHMIKVEWSERRFKQLSHFMVSAMDDDGEKMNLINFFPFASSQITTPFEFMRKLFEWHFWPFGDEFFEQGLVIDKMKVK